MKAKSSLGPISTTTKFIFLEICTTFCLILFLGCNKDQETSVINSITVPALYNDSLYSVDSVLMVNKYELLWDYLNNEKNNDLLTLSKEMTPRLEHLLKYRYDSTLYMIYTESFSGAGWALTFLNKPEEGRTYARKAYAMIADKFGESHIRKIENCVNISVSYLVIGDYDHAIEWE